MLTEVQKSVLYFDLISYSWIRKVQLLKGIDSYAIYYEIYVTLQVLQKKSLRPSINITKFATSFSSTKHSTIPKALPNKIFLKIEKNLGN